MALTIRHAAELKRRSVFMQKLACIVYSALNISLNICWLPKLGEKKTKNDF